MLLIHLCTHTILEFGKSRLIITLLLHVFVYLTSLNIFSFRVYFLQYIDAKAVYPQIEYEGMHLTSELKPTVLSSKRCHNTLSCSPCCSIDKNTHARTLTSDRH